MSDHSILIVFVVIAVSVIVGAVLYVALKPKHTTTTVQMPSYSQPAVQPAVVQQPATVVVSPTYDNGYYPQSLYDTSYPFLSPLYRPRWGGWRGW